MAEREDSRGHPGDAELFWALYGRSAEEFPGLDEILQKYGLLGAPEETTVTVEPKPLSLREYIGTLLPLRRETRPVDRFIAEAKARGLIKPKGLSLRQYIGALLR